MKHLHAVEIVDDMAKEMEPLTGAIESFWRSYRREGMRWFLVWFYVLPFILILVFVGRFVGFFDPETFSLVLFFLGFWWLCYAVIFFVFREEIRKTKKELREREINRERPSHDELQRTMFR